VSGREPLILLIEDDPQMLRFFRTLLCSNGYRLHQESTGASGLSAAAQHNPDVVLLDLGLPDIDGIEVTRRLREWSSSPIIVISARDMDRDKIAALDLGADDYLTKPFSAGELLARLRVALRHAASRSAAAGDNRIFESGDLRVDFAARRVLRAGQAVRLTPLEYTLLVTLVRHAGKVLTHRQILKEVWGPGSMEQAHYVRVYMAQLRRKLEPEPARPQYLVTEVGVGYRFRVVEDEV
jgi:two-component system, OmpR family, KDP operon response regulator KdpE